MIKTLNHKPKRKDFTMNNNRLYKNLHVIKKTFHGVTERVRHSTLTANQRKALRETAHYMRVYLDARGIQHQAPSPLVPRQLQDLAIPFANQRNFNKRYKAFLSEVNSRAESDANTHYEHCGTGFESTFRERYQYWYQNLKELYGF